MASLSGTYHEKEIQILQNVYDRGLRSKSKQKDLLNEAKDKTGLNYERIMQWVHSKASREKAQSMGKSVVKLTKRKPTLYSVALSDVLSNKAYGSNIKERTQAQGVQWKRLRDDPEQFLQVQQRYEEKVKDYNEKILNPSKDERKRRDKWLITKLEKVIDELNKNGTEVATVLVHSKFGTCTTRGTLKGEDFLEDRQDIVVAFHHHCTGNERPCTFDSLQSLRRQTTSLWNEKYSEAVQKPYQHVPYTAIAKKEISIILHGTDVQFKETKLYRRKELEQVIEKKGCIKMQIIQHEGSSKVSQSEHNLNSVRQTDIIHDKRDEPRLISQLDYEENPDLGSASRPQNSNDTVLPQKNGNAVVENDAGFIYVDGERVEVVLEDENTNKEQANAESSIFPIARGSLILSDWGKCGTYFGYIQQSCIEWSSKPIMINKNKKVIGVRKKIKLGSKPVDRTKVDDHGHVISIIPKVLYCKTKSIIQPSDGFKEYVESTMNN